MSKKTFYVISKMTNSVSYCFYTERRNPNDVPSIREKITILGGCGMPSHRSGFGERTEDIQGQPLWVADGIVMPGESRSSTTTSSATTRLCPQSLAIWLGRTPKPF
jgi:hypothetical protein